MAEQGKHIIELTRDHWRGLRVILTGQGVFKDPAMLFRGSKLACTIDDMLDEAPQPKPVDMDAPTKEEVDALVAWGEVKATLELTEKERDACKHAFNEVVKAGSLRAPPKLFLALMEALGLAPTD